MAPRCGIRCTGNDGEGCRSGYGYGGSPDHLRLPLRGQWSGTYRVGLFGGSASGSVLLAELVHAARGIHDLLLTGIERMAVRADFHLQIVTQGRAGLERVAARAADGDLFVLGMA